MCSMQTLLFSSTLIVVFRYLWNPTVLVKFKLIRSIVAGSFSAIIALAGEDLYAHFGNWFKSGTSYCIPYKIYSHCSFTLFIRAFENILILAWRYFLQLLSPRWNNALQVKFKVSPIKWHCAISSLHSITKQFLSIGWKLSGLIGKKSKTLEMIREANKSKRRSSSCHLS